MYVSHSRWAPTSLDCKFISSIKKKTWDMSYSERIWFQEPPRISLLLGTLLARSRAGWDSPPDGWNSGSLRGQHCRRQRPTGKGEEKTLILFYLALCLCLGSGRPLLNSESPSLLCNPRQWSSFTQQNISLNRCCELSEMFFLVKLFWSLL